MFGAILQRITISLVIRLLCCSYLFLEGVCFMTENTSWKSKFFFVALGQAISLLGSHGVQFALIWMLAEKTSSPLVLGIAGIAAYIPMTIFSPFAGIAADRYNRKLISIFSDMGIGLVALIYAILSFYFDMPIWTIFIMLFVRGLGGTFQQPAIQSIIPQLVPSDKLVKTNGWMQLMTSGSFILGPVIGAIMYGSFPMWLILVTDVIGATLASIALGVVKIPKLERLTTDKVKMSTQIKEGLMVFYQDKRLFYLVMAEFLAMLFFAPLSSYYPLLTSDYFDLSATFGSIVEVLFAIGMMISSLLFSTVIKVNNKIKVSFIGLIAMGIVSLLIGVLPPYFWGWVMFTLLCAVLGASMNVHTIPMYAYMQETIDQHKMGRAFSVITLISSVTMPIGLIISSPVAEKVGVNSWFLISGILITIITLVIMSIYKIKYSTNKSA